MHHHASLGKGESGEHADRIERKQRVELALVHEDQRSRDDEKQRLAFARVLLQRPQWLVLNGVLELLDASSRKRIEAAGVRDFQQIVAQGITPSLLEWKGIEATENLAKSANSKVVVIGNNKNGLPLILGQ